MLSASCPLFFQCFCDHRDPHSFPTRRSSDLRGAAMAGDLTGAGVSRPDDGDAGADRPAWLATALPALHARQAGQRQDRKSTRLNSSHVSISYAVFCLKKKKKKIKKNLSDTRE